MYLYALHISDFRCYDTLEIDNLGKLAVFIGENDAGKTVILDAIEILVGKRTQILPRDFRRTASGTFVDSFAITGTFNLSEHDSLPEEFRSGDQLILKRRFTQGTSAVTTEVLVVGKSCEDERFDSFAALKADVQKSLLRDLGVEPSPNGAGRIAQVEQMKADGRLPLTQREVLLAPMKANQLLACLPRTERIASTEYRTPESVVQRAFQSVAAQVIAPVDPATNKPREIEELVRVRELIEAALNAEAGKILPALKASHRKLENVFVRPNISFEKAVTATPLSLDCGEGEQGIDHFGEGTKKRVWMGLLDWERQVVDREAIRNVIRLYDEPDVNLDYQSQRRLFASILDLADDQEAEIQCVVCTHSMQLIDRAPITALSLIRVEEDSRRTLVRVQGLDDADYTDFFNDVGQAVGLSNTALFYERAFLVVEGESEEAAIPVIYQNIFKRSMRDDGIRIINLTTCGAWKSVLKILLKNRLEVVHLLLDTDCTYPDSTAHLTPEVLSEVGCPEDFATSQVTYIGAKEFEDAFAEGIIHEGVRTAFSFEDEAWSADDIAAMKAASEKFSEDFKVFVLKKCVKAERSRVKKHTIAEAVARQCTCEADVPPALLHALTQVRILAGACDDA